MALSRCSHFVFLLPEAEFGKREIPAGQRRCQSERIPSPTIPSKVTGDQAKGTICIERIGGIAAEREARLTDGSRRFFFIPHPFTERTERQTLTDEGEFQIAGVLHRPEGAVTPQDSMTDISLNSKIETIVGWMDRYFPEKNFVSEIEITKS
jgi:hypothetical protein